MPKILAIMEDGASAGSIKIEHGVAVLRMQNLPIDEIGVETSDDAYSLSDFLLNMGGFFTHLELQPDRVLAVLYDLKTEAGTEIKEQLRLNGTVGVHKLRNPVKRLLGTPTSVS